MHRRYFAIKIESKKFDSDPHPPCIEPSCIQFSSEFRKRGQKILPQGVALVWHTRWSSYLRHAVTRVAWNVTTDGRVRSRRWLRHVVHSVLVERSWIFKWHVRMSCGYVQVERKIGGQAYTRRSYTTLTNSLIHSLTPWSRLLLEKLTGFQLVKKFPAIYASKRFITAFTSVRHLSLSWVSSIQSTIPHSTSWKSILILSSHLRLGLPSGLYPSGVSPKPCIRLSFPPIHATCTAQLIVLDFITRTILG